MSQPGQSEWNEQRIDELAELLRDVWDPIGVGDDPDGAGEYRHEAEELSGLLTTDAKVERVEEALRAAEIGAPRTSHRDAALAVVEWYERVIRGIQR